jgi:hypothetical protein
VAETRSGWEPSSPEVVLVVASGDGDPGVPAASGAIEELLEPSVPDGTGLSTLPAPTSVGP